ncbi:MAG: cell wall-binding protein, partial [Limisphaerales bacterium]
MKPLIILITLLSLAEVGFGADALDFWTLQSAAPTTNQLSAVTYGNGEFVAVGDAGTIVTSPNGVAWTSRNSGTTNWLGSVAYGNGRFVAVGNATLTSPDGIGWTSRDFVSGVSSVTYGNGLFVAVGYRIFTSPDGITWTWRSDYGMTNWLASVAFGGYGQFVAVGSK